MPRGTRMTAMLRLFPRASCALRESAALGARLEAPGRLCSRPHHQSLAMSSISGRIRAYQEHSKSPVDVVAACLTAAETAVPLNAYTAMQEKDAILACAEESATRYLNSTTMGPLDGIPIAVKDNFCTKDLPTSCGSNMLRGFQAPYDATVVRRLRNSGAIFTGKTNMDEFGMGSFNTASAYGPALNPAGLAVRLCPSFPTCCPSTSSCRGVSAAAAH